MKGPVQCAEQPIRDAKCNVTTTFMFESCRRWNVQDSAPTNLWHAKQNVTTIFMLDSGHTWNVHYNARSNRNHRQHHQIAPAKKNYTRNVHCNAWSNRSHPPTAPNITPVTKHDTWNVQYNARSKRGHSPTSPKIAPAKLKKWAEKELNCEYNWRHLETHDTHGIAV